jgi:hypothetical protein
MNKVYVFIVLALLQSLASTAHSQVCTREYAPVCGQVPGESVAQTFSNRCLLKAARATEIAQGTCAIEKPPLVGGDTDAHGCKPSAGYLCNGLFEKQCLVVREVEDSRSKNRGQAGRKWEPLFDEIAGFKKAPGKRYILRVRKDRLENLPADESDTNYTLLRVLK